MEALSGPFTQGDFTGKCAFTAGDCIVINPHWLLVFAGDFKVIPMHFFTPIFYLRLQVVVMLLIVCAGNGGDSER